jgi:hypothetical protein
VSLTLKLVDSILDHLQQCDGVEVFQNLFVGVLALELRPHAVGALPQNEWENLF